MSVMICNIPIVLLRIKVLLRSVLRHQAMFLTQLMEANRLLAPFPVAFRQASFKPRPSLARVSLLLNLLKRPMTLSRLPGALKVLAVLARRFLSCPMTYRRPESSLNIAKQVLRKSQRVNPELISYSRFFFCDAKKGFV